jgi:DNA-binding NarL/FixJ family response regulator
VTDYKILLVDDFEEFRRFVSAVLKKRAEFQLYQASDGEEAIQRAAEFQPDLVLLDIRLPRLNGIEAGRRIREVSPSSKIIFVSQESSVDIVREAMELGAYGYLWKSDAAVELLPAVDAVLQGKLFLSRRVSSLRIDKTHGEEPRGRLRPKELSSLRVEERETRRIHEVAFHQDDASFVNDFAGFIEAALKASNPVIVLATESHRDGIVQRLEAHGWDITAAVQEGWYISLDTNETLATFMVNDWPDPARFLRVAGDLITKASRTAKEGHSKVAVCGECAPVLCRRGKTEAAVEVEHLFNVLARRYQIETLCGYVLGDFQRKEDSRIFERVCAEHSATRFPQGQMSWHV